MKTTGFVGKWRTIHMDDFAKKDIDMEVPAFIKIDRGGCGEFQFILVHGNIDGRTVSGPDGKTRFEFTWEGNDDECDEASGAGWFGLKDDDNDEKNAMIEGEIKIHNGGDSSKFVAHRAAERKKERKTDKPVKHHTAGSTRFRGK